MSPWIARWRVLLSILISLFIISTIITAAAKAATKIEITIPESAEVSGPWIQLGDIARITGVEEEKLDNLKQMNLGKALHPGYTKEIPREEIILLLQNNGYQPDELTLNIPPRVLVTTKSRKLDADELILRARQFLLRQLPFPAENVQITSTFIPPVVVIPEQEYQLKVELVDPTRLTGNLSLRLVIEVEGEVIKQVYLGFQVKVKREVLLAKRSINPGERINSADFSAETSFISSWQGEIITDLSNRLVKEGIVKIPIKKGELLTSYYLTIPDIIFNGDVIMAEVIVGSIKVMTPVVACENGKKGEYITVVNQKTDHRFQAVVVDSHLVRLIQE